MEKRNKTVEKRYISLDIFTPYYKHNEKGNLNMLTVKKSIVELKTVYKFTVEDTHNKIPSCTFSIRKDLFKEQMDVKTRKIIELKLRMNIPTVTRCIKDRLLREMRAVVKQHNENKEKSEQKDNVTTTSKEQHMNKYIVHENFYNGLLQLFSDVMEKLPKNNFTKSHNRVHSTHTLNFSRTILNELEKTNSFLEKGKKSRYDIDRYTAVLAVFHDLWDRKFEDSDAVRSVQLRVTQQCVESYLPDTTPEQLDALLFKYNVQYSYNSLLVSKKQITQNKHQLDKVPMKELICMVVSDADKLDACGAIGFIRSIISNKQDTGIILFKPEDISDKQLFNEYRKKSEYLADTNAGVLRHTCKKLIHLHHYMFTDYARNLGQEKCKLLEWFVKDLVESLRN